MQIEVLVGLGGALFWIVLAVALSFVSCTTHTSPRQMAAMLRLEHVDLLSSCAPTSASTVQDRTRPVILSVEGAIGSGKSTLLRSVAEQLGSKVEVIQEGVELWRALPSLPSQGGAPTTHNLLASYYTDPAKYAVAFQTFTLATRVEMLDDALKRIAAKPAAERPDIILLERSAGGDACFATMLHEDGVIDDAWYASYQYTRALYARFVPEVDGIIDMGVGVETAMARLRERARGEEVGVTPQYQAHLVRTIATWLAAEERPVLTLDAGAWDGSHVDVTKARSLATHIAEFALLC